MNNKKKLKKVHLFIISIFIFQNLHSQVHQEWITKYRDSCLAYCMSMCIDNQNNIFLSGCHNQGKRGKYFTYKFSNNGVYQWSRFYSGPDTIPQGDNDVAIKNGCDKFGNIYVTGYSLSFNNLNYEDILTIKYSSQGDKIWERRYDNHYSDIPVQIIIDRNSNIYICGTTYVSSNSNFGMVILKYDPEGNLVWDRIYSTIYYCKAVDMAIDSIGNIYTLGLTYDSLYHYFYASVLVKYSNEGNFVWKEMYQCNNKDYKPTSICTDILNNIYITGTIMLNQNYPDGNITLKYDTNKNLIWYKQHNMYEGEAAYSLLVDTKSNVYVNTMFEVMKYDSSGVFKWSDSTYCSAKKLFLDNKDNLYIVQSRTDSTFQNYLFATAKMNTEYGGLIWERIYNAISGYAIDARNFLGLPDKNDGIIVNFLTWKNYPPNQNTDSNFLIKYSQTSSVNPIFSEITDNFKLFQNYPNPFNAVASIKYQVSRISIVKLVVYDILGKDVETLVNQYQRTGTYKVSINGNNLSSGIYFYSLFVDGNRVDTKKMLLIK